MLFNGIFNSSQPKRTSIIRTFLTIALSATLIQPSNCYSIEAVSPESTCERFVIASDKKKCLQEIKKIMPDSYLAAVCEKQFDDKSYYDCMKLSEHSDFDPIKVSQCDSQDINDQERMACLKTAANLKNTQKNMNRLPASKKNKARSIHPK